MKTTNKNLKGVSPYESPIKQFEGCLVIIEEHCPDENNGSIVQHVLYLNTIEIVYYGIIKPCLNQAY